MDMMDTLKDQKPTTKDNPLVVLNPVTEELSDPPSTWLSYQNSLQQQGEKLTANTSQNQSKTPTVSCFCCPTRECRRNSLFSFSDNASSKDPNMMSAIEKSLLALYADKSGYMNPLAAATLYGNSFNEFDPSSLASLACLQSSLLNAGGNMMCGSSSPLSNVSGKTGLERMLETEIGKQSKESSSKDKVVTTHYKETKLASPPPENSKQVKERSVLSPQNKGLCI